MNALKRDGRDGVRAVIRLLACADRVQKLCQRRFREHFDATLPRFDVMAALAAAGGPITMGALSGRLLVSNGAVTGVVASLVEAGLVVQREKPGDRRTRLVSLTPAGRARFDAMAEAHRDWTAEIFDALPEDARAQLMSGLIRMLAALEAADPPAKTGEDDVSAPAYDA